MDRFNSILRYLKRKKLEKAEKIMQVVVELALILMNVKKIGEMRVNLIFIAKVEVMNQVGVNLLDERV